MKKILFIAILLMGFLSNAQSIPSKIYVGTDVVVSEGPEVTSISVDNITTSSFRVSWSVSPNGTGQVEFYQTDTPETLYYTTLQPTYDSNHIQSPGDNGNGTNLTPNTSYTFRVIGSTEFEGDYQGEWQEVTTLADIPSISIASTDNTATELSETTGTYTVTMSEVNDTGSAITVNYTVSGTATPTTDYVALSGTVDIANGTDTATITLTPSDDGLVEPNETVIVTLSSGTGYNVGSPNSATITIADDDGSGDPTVTIVASDGTATESGTTTGEYTVNLSSTSTGTTTINYTVSGTAVSGSDFIALSGSVDITDGNDSATITLTPQDDDDVESNETVIVTLSNGAGYIIGSPSSASVTIISEDSGGGDILASVFTTDPIATENGTTTGEFTFNLSEVNDTGSPITINYHMNGHAIEGTDYSSLSGTIDIPNGSQTATLTIAPLNDTEPEADETVEVIIDSGSGYSTEGLDRAILEITDNDNTSASYPTTSGTSTIANATDFENAANAGTLATVTGSFSVTGLTPANGMVLKAGGGVLSGTLDVSTIGIEASNNQLFSSSISFNAVYDKSKLPIEMFGAVADDASDDNDAIEAGWNNVENIYCGTSGVYIKNDHSSFSRSGKLNWNLNGSTIRTTSASNFNTTSYSIDELFRLSNIQAHVFNGTFDLNNTYGRAFRILTYTRFSFKDLIFENFWNPQPIRSYAIRASGASNLIYGEFLRNTFRNITAQGDNASNNSDGISKGIWMECGNISNADFEIVHYGNTYHDIGGDDAEAVYYTASGDRVHNGHTLFDNETFYEIGRRAIKMTKGNFTVQNSDFTEISTASFVSVQLTATMFDVFSTSGGNLQNVKAINNTLRSNGNEYMKRWYMSFTNTENVLVKGNTFDIWNSMGLNNSKSPSVAGLGAIRLGSNTSSYTGDIRNVTIKENIFKNASIEVMQYFGGTIAGKTIVVNNTFNYDNITGSSQSPIDFYNVGGDTKGYIDFNNNNIVFDDTGNFGGIISSDGSGITITEFNADNNTITINTGSLTYEIGNVAGDLTNSDFTNITVIGGSGSPVLNISGSQTGTTAGPGNTPAITIN
jgi:hypothetical protein